MEKLKRAYEISKKYFEGKLDKGGYPYINHLEYVSKHGRNESEKIIGLLHDILEDTDLTKEKLLEFGFSKEIVEVIEILTRDKNKSYHDYIESIILSKNESAIYIKKIDMEHNMDLKRCPNLDEKTKEKLQKKYAKNYPIICKALKKCSKEEKT